MDCTFTTPEGKFNLRVGAVITDGSRELPCPGIAVHNRKRTVITP